MQAYVIYFLQDAHNAWSVHMYMHTVFVPKMVFTVYISLFAIPVCLAWFVPQSGVHIYILNGTAQAVKPLNPDLC